MRFAVFAHIPTLICVVALGLCADVASAEVPETLILKSGEQIWGIHRDITSEGIVWERPDGRRLVVPLENVDRIGYSLLGIPPRFEQTDELATTADDEEPTDEDSSKNLLDATMTSIDDLFDSTIDGFVDWTQRIELGGRLLDGNSDQDFINIGGKFEQTEGRSSKQLDFAGQYGRSDGDVTTNRWNANITYDYGKHGKSSKWIVFVVAKNELDEFENLDYRGTYSSGLGYRFYNEKEHKLIVRVGPAVTYERYRDPVVNRTTPDVLGEFELVWPFYGRSSFESKATVHPSVNDISFVRLVSTNGLMFRLDEHGRWKLKLGFRFEYNSNPNKNRLPADFTSSIVLVYTRK